MGKGEEDLHTQQIREQPGGGAADRPRVGAGFVAAAGAAWCRSPAAAGSGDGHGVSIPCSRRERRQPEGAGAGAALASARQGRGQPVAHQGSRLAVGPTYWRFGWCLLCGSSSFEHCGQFVNLRSRKMHVKLYKSLEILNLFCQIPEILMYTVKILCCMQKLK